MLNSVSVALNDRMCSREADVRRTGNVPEKEIKYFADKKCFILTSQNKDIKNQKKTSHDLY